MKMMNDITMCLNENCKVKDQCYRHTATPDKLQSYSMFSTDTEKCEYYWEDDRWQKEDIKYG